MLKVEWDPSCVPLGTTDGTSRPNAQGCEDGKDAFPKKFTESCSEPG